MSLRDDTGTVVADGDVGEVCFRSPAACIGYWRDEAASAALGWSDGFVRMSDEGRVLTGGAAAGCLQLVGRTKEMFVRGGYNVYPMEVEAVLAAHPAVAEVAIVPRSDDVMGDIGVAVVVPRSTARPPSLDELRELGATRLSNHKLPEALEIAEALPRTAMDKLDRGQLTREFA
jgi:acyl-CoA synthetase (AMP-forming)/AMP-acid ligase II